MMNRILQGWTGALAGSALAGLLLVPAGAAAQWTYWAEAEGAPDAVSFEYRQRDHGCDNSLAEWRAVNRSDDWLEVTIHRIAYDCPGKLEDDERTSARRFGTIGPGDAQERSRDSRVCGGARALGATVLEYEVSQVEAPDDE